MKIGTEFTKVLQVAGLDDRKEGMDEGRPHYIRYDALLKQSSLTRLMETIANGSWVIMVASTILKKSLKEERSILQNA